MNADLVASLDPLSPNHVPKSPKSPLEQLILENPCGEASQETKDQLVLIADELSMFKDPQKQIITTARKPFLQLGRQTNQQFDIPSATDIKSTLATPKPPLAAVRKRFVPSSTRPSPSSSRVFVQKTLKKPALGRWRSVPTQIEPKADLSLPDIL